MTEFSSSKRISRPFDYQSLGDQFALLNVDGDDAIDILMPESAAVHTFGGQLAVQGTGSSIATITPKDNVTGGDVIAEDLVVDQTDPAGTLYTSIGPAQGGAGSRSGADGHRIYLAWTYDVAPTAGPTLLFWVRMFL